MFSRSLFFAAGNYRYRLFSAGDFKPDYAAYRQHFREKKMKKYWSLYPLLSLPPPADRSDEQVFELSALKRRFVLQNFYLRIPRSKGLCGRLWQCCGKLRRQLALPYQAMYAKFSRQTAAAAIGQTDCRSRMRNGLFNRMADKTLW